MLELIISSGKWLAAVLEHSEEGCLPQRGSSPRISPSQRHSMNGCVCFCFFLFFFFQRANHDSQSSLEAFLLCKEKRNARSLMQWQLRAHGKWKGGCLMAKRWVDAGSGSEVTPGTVSVPHIRRTGRGSWNHKVQFGNFSHLCQALVCVFLIWFVILLCLKYLPKQGVSDWRPHKRKWIEEEEEEEN